MMPDIEKRFAHQYYKAKDYKEVSKSEL